MSSGFLAQTLNSKKFSSMVARRMVLRDPGDSNGSKTLHLLHCCPSLDFPLSWNMHILILLPQTQYQSSTHIFCLDKWAVVFIVCIRITSYNWKNLCPLEIMILWSCMGIGTVFCLFLSLLFVCLFVFSDSWWIWCRWPNVIFIVFCIHSIVKH